MPANEGTGVIMKIFVYRLLNHALVIFWLAVDALTVLTTHTQTYGEESNQNVGVFFISLLLAALAFEYYYRS